MYSDARIIIVRSTKQIDSPFQPDKLAPSSRTRRMCVTSVIGIHPDLFRNTYSTAHWGNCVDVGRVAILQLACHVLHGFWYALPS